jgi:hypothetical protein
MQTKQKEILAQLLADFREAQRANAHEAQDSREKFTAGRADAFADAADWLESAIAELSLLGPS